MQILNKVIAKTATILEHILFSTCIIHNILSDAEFAFV